MVFKRLLGIKPKPELKTFAAPAGQRIYAIGDIHGRLDLFDALIELIDADNAARGAAETHLIVLGDLVDRGPHSRGVIDRVMQLIETRPNVRCLGGNHEDMMLRCCDGDVKVVSTFHRVGGRETLLSYGVSADAYDAAAYEEVVELARAAVPQAHLDFLEGLEDFVRAGDYLFVHAGIRPDVALAEQTREDMRWIRREFTEADDEFGVMVIHGHTITEEVDERANRIGIDTGAYATGRLTAIGLEGSERWFLATPGVDLG